MTPLYGRTRPLGPASIMVDWFIGDSMVGTLMRTRVRTRRTRRTWVTTQVRTRDDAAPFRPRARLREQSFLLQRGRLGQAEHDIEVLHRLPRRALHQVVD